MTLKRVPYHFLGLGVVSVIFGVLATAQRWQRIIRTIAIPIPLWDAVYHTAIGSFLSQCLPSSVGGDVYKGIILKQHYKISTTLSVSTTLIDRLYGIASFVIFAILGCFVEWKTLITTSLGEMMVLVVAFVAGGLLTMYGLKFARALLPVFLKPIVDFSEAVTATFSDKKEAVLIFLTSQVASLLVIIAAFLLSVGMGLSLTLSQVFVVIPLVVIISAIPISFAGWGLREGAMVVILSVYGIPKEEALALSLLFGVVQFLAALPGLILWCFAKKPNLLSQPQKS